MNESNAKPMNTFHILYVACILSMCAVVSFGQEKEITSDEYYTRARAARDKGRGLNRHQISKTTRVKDGKMTNAEEWQYKFDLPGRIHYVHIVNSNGKASRTEEINIDGAKYCKMGDAPWEQITGSCIMGSGLSSGPSPESTKYTVEKVRLNKKEITLYRQYIIYKNNSSENKENEGRSFYESKFWLSKDGLIIREERSDGLIEPKRINRVTIDTYEYDPQIKIEAPIKP